MTDGGGVNNRLLEKDKLVRGQSQDASAARELESPSEFRHTVNRLKRHAVLRIECPFLTGAISIETIWVISEHGGKVMHHSQLAPLPTELPFRIVSKTIGQGAYAWLVYGLDTKAAKRY
jgi:hypothetical protein